MSSIIDFSNLKRKNLRCIIFENDKNKAKIVYKDFELYDIENPIEIYNPTKEQKEKIADIIQNSIDKNGNSAITGEMIIKVFLPMLTNIKLDLDDDILKEVIEDPSDVLLMVQDEIGSILNSIINFVRNDIETLMELPKEERNMLIKKLQEEKLIKEKSNAEELTEEELAIIEKAKKLGKI